MTADGNRGLIRLAEVTKHDMDANTRAIAAGKAVKGDQFVATWFLPLVTHALKGGVRTVFMLAGELVETAPTRVMFTTPSDPRTEAYITGRFG